MQHYEEGDIGVLYGINWRHFGVDYKGCSHNYENQGFDQLKNLISDLKNDPYSRRHMITTFNPAEVKNSVLAPCHGIVTQFYVEDNVELNKKYLSCHVYCRSSDSFLGLPFNIASYGMFLHIIAKLVDMAPKELIISTGDTHIYLNYLKQVEQQLEREPLPFPKFVVSDKIKEKDINDITLEDFELIGYLYHPAIKADMAV